MVEADVFRDDLGVQTLPVFARADQDKIPRLQFDRDAAIHVEQNAAQNDGQIVVGDDPSGNVHRSNVEMMVIIAQRDRIHSIRSC